MYDSITGLATLIGITSFGQKCGDPQNPAVYGRVDAALTWITDVKNTL